VVRVLAQVFFETFEQREGVGGAAGEADEDLPAPDAPDLAGIVLHHRIAQRHLPVAAQRHLTVATNGEDRGRAGGVCWHRSSRSERRRSSMACRLASICGRGGE